MKANMILCSLVCVILSGCSMLQKENSPSNDSADTENFSQTIELVEESPEAEGEDESEAETPNSPGGISIGGGLGPSPE